jgi:hypothetical protein
VPHAGARQEGQDLADRGFRGGRVAQREVLLDLVAVTAAVLVLDDVPGVGEVGHDAVGAALGDVQAAGDFAQPGARVAGEAQQDPGVVGQETPALHPENISFVF